MPARFTSFRLRTAAIVVLVCSLSASALSSQQTTADPGTSKSGGPYLFAYFVGNGEDGLHFASSTDGLTWTALRGGASYLAPTAGSKLMRDPCIVLGPDGVFHMVWTTGWWDRGIGVAHSKDLVEWSEQQFVPVMAHEPRALNSWAPEIVYDAAQQQYLVFWATTIPGRFAATDESGSPLKEGGRTNHRMYSTTTKDFRDLVADACLLRRWLQRHRRHDRAGREAVRHGGEGRDAVSRREEESPRGHGRSHRRTVRVRLRADFDRLGRRAVAARHQQRLAAVLRRIHPASLRRPALARSEDVATRNRVADVSAGYSAWDRVWRVARRAREGDRREVSQLLYLASICSLALAPILVVQGRRVRRVTPRLPEAGGPREGRIDGASPVRRVLVLGESTAAGVGVRSHEDGLAGHVARTVAAATGCGIEWMVRGRIGATVQSTRVELLPQAAGFAADVAVLALGVNDTLRLSRPAPFIAALGALCAALRSARPSIGIVIAAVPPMGQFPTLPTPLRDVLGLRARVLDAATRRLCTDARVRHVPMPNPGTHRVSDLFCEDGFHPSALGYREWGHALGTACVGLLETSAARRLAPHGSMP
jgi:lysophospholipase L1-like esterase